MIRQQLYGSVAASAIIAASGPSGLFGNLPTANAVVGWGLIRRNPNYNGPAIRVKDFNSASQIDINFDADGFCSAVAPYLDTRVITVYDQWGAENLTALENAIQRYYGADESGYLKCGVIRNENAPGVLSSISQASADPTWKQDRLTFMYSGRTNLPDANYKHLFRAQAASGILTTYGIQQRLADIAWRADGAVADAWANTGFVARAYDGKLLSFIGDFTNATQAFGYLDGELRQTSTFDGTLSAYISNGNMLVNGGITSEAFGCEFIELHVFDQVGAAVLSVADRNQIYDRSQNPKLPLRFYDGFSDGIGYLYTGENATYTVPSGVTQIQIALSGGGGGSGDYGTGENGGGGGFTNLTLDVVQGDVVVFQVGRGGRGVVNSPRAAGAGGWPDGGGGGRGDASGAGGGGSTRVWLNSVLQGVAGGGGGDAGYAGNGGAGGGVVGGKSYFVGQQATGGSQVAGGTDFNEPTGNKVGLQITSMTPARTGGWGATVGDLVSSTGDDGGGGGGGYWGGGGGGGDGKAGAGGSGYVRSGAGISDAVTYNGDMFRPHMYSKGHPNEPAGASIGGVSGGFDRHGGNGWAALSTNNFGISLTPPPATLRASFNRTYAVLGPQNDRLGSRFTRTHVVLGPQNDRLGARHSRTYIILEP